MMDVRRQIKIHEYIYTYITSLRQYKDLQGIYMHIYMYIYIHIFIYIHIII
jgi:hypothetical protein